MIKWFLQRPIRTKFAIVFAIILGAVLLQSYLTLRAVQNDQTSFASVTENQSQLNDGDDAFQHLASVQSNYRGFLITGDEKFVDDLKQEEAGYKARIGSLEQQPDPAAAEQWRRIDNAIADWHETVNSGVALRRKVNEGTADQSEVAAFVSSGVGQKQFEDIARLVDDAQNATQAKVQFKADEAKISGNRVLLFILASGLLVGLLLLWTLFNLRRRIAGPLNVAVGKASAIAQGNVDLEPFPVVMKAGPFVVPLEDSKDEIAMLQLAMNGTVETLNTVDQQARAISEGRMSDPVLERPVPGPLGASLQQMTENLRQYAELSKALSDGDLSADVQPRSPDDELGTIAAAMTENLRTMVGNVRTVTEQVSDGAKALADGAEESAQLASDVADAVSTINGGIAGQARATEDVSGAVADIGAQVRSTVSAVDEAKRASDRAGQLGQAGQQRVDEVVHAMERIASSMDDVSSSVNELTAQARQVDNMVELIQSIADQTNLLALNASIEAARAGAAGRGFAVVASEVKALSEQASTATSEIGQIVDRMRQDADHAVVVLASEQADVTLGAGAVAAAGTAFAEIVDGIEAIAGRIAEVEDAAQRIDGSASTIETRTTELVELSTVNSAGIEEVAAASEQTAATAEEIGATAHELAASVETLREVMARIRSPEQLVPLEPVVRQPAIVVGDPALPSGGGVLRRGGRHRKR